MHKQALAMRRVNIENTDTTLIYILKNKYLYAIIVIKYREFH